MTIIISIINLQDLLYFYIAVLYLICIIITILIEMLYFDQSQAKLVFSHCVIDVERDIWCTASESVIEKRRDFN